MDECANQKMCLKEQDLWLEMLWLEHTVYVYILINQDNQKISRDLTWYSILHSSGVGSLAETFDYKE